MADWRTSNSSSSTRRLMVAVAISGAILLGWDTASYWLFGGKEVAAQKQQEQTLAQTAAPQTAAALPEQTNNATVTMASITPTTALPPVVLENDRLILTLDPNTGGRITTWQLKKYGEELNDTDGYTLLGTANAKPSYFQSGWQGAGVSGPSDATRWSVATQTEGSVTLTWQNTSGQNFARTLTLNPNTYVVQVTEAVQNTAALPTAFRLYTQLSQVGEGPDAQKSSFVNTYGAMGVTDGEKASYTLHQEEYKNLTKHTQSNKVLGTGGWWGLTSHFFMAATLPGTAEETERWFKASTDSLGQQWYTANTQWTSTVIAPGATQAISYDVFGGPKQDTLLKDVGHNLGAAIDWGWFRVIAQPLHHVLVWLHSYVGNWGLAVMGLTLCLKILTFPLASKSYRAMAKMKKLQPEVEELKKRHGTDQQQMAAQMMALYGKHKVNPLSGCWPMLIQIPIFFAMYKVVLVSFEFRHAPLALWIHDLSVMDPFYVLPVIMGASMFVQMRMQPPAADPTQAMVFKWMPVMFTVMFLWFPAGLVLYWITNNCLSIAQQWFITKQVNKAA